jgi:hypothetical protein
MVEMRTLDIGNTVNPEAGGCQFAGAEAFDEHGLAVTLKAHLRW